MARPPASSRGHWSEGRSLEPPADRKAARDPIRWVILNPSTPKQNPRARSKSPTLRWALPMRAAATTGRGSMEDSSLSHLVGAFSPAAPARLSDSSISSATLSVGAPGLMPKSLRLIVKVDRSTQQACR